MVLGPGSTHLLLQKPIFELGADHVWQETKLYKFFFSGRPRMQTYLSKKIKRTVFTKNICQKWTKFLQLYPKIARLQKYKLQKGNPHQNRQKFDKTKSAENVKYPIIETTPATLKYEHGVCKKVFSTKINNKSTKRIATKLTSTSKQKLKNASKIIFLFRWWMTFMENRSPLMAFVPLFAW